MPGHARTIAMSGGGQAPPLANTRLSCATILQKDHVLLEKGVTLLMGLVSCTNLQYKWHTAIP